MALSNAERQKRYRETRKEKVSELESLRNEIEELKHTIYLQGLSIGMQERSAYARADENRTLAKENENLRNELEELRNLRKKSRKTKDHVTQESAFFYVEHGELKILDHPETLGTLKTRNIQTINYSQIDKKYHKQANQLIADYNARLDELNKNFL